nr:NAD-dependent succinate-semialdehyde dehydrogenase [Sphingomonas sp. Y57]
MPANDQHSGTTTVNPATGEVFAFHPYASSDSISNILDANLAAFARWRVTPLEGRLGLFGRLADILRSRCEAFAVTITREMGKPVTQSRAEVLKCATACEWYAVNGAAMMADERVMVDQQTAWISYEPLGTVLGIMPWNYPCWQAIRAIIPVLLSGNAFALKHAPNSISTALNVVAAFEEAGAPAGLVTSLNIDNDAVANVIADDRIAAVTLTGSVRAGSAVAALAGRAIKKTVLELGGSDPFIVLADADVDAAVEAAVWARFQNCGQTCIAAKRLIVDAAIAPDFTAKFVAAVERLAIGDPMLDDTLVGPMARADLRAELEDQVARSVAAGAVTLLEGGRSGPAGSAYFRPVVLGDVTPGMAAFDEETFGPCAAITVAGDVEEAARLANRSQFGLSAALWTSDIERARDLARRLDTGSVFINGISRSDPRAPIGGIRKSGYGRELSHFGVREFTNVKTVWLP